MEVLRVIVNKKTASAAVQQKYMSMEYWRMAEKKEQARPPSSPWLFNCLAAVESM